MNPRRTVFTWSPDGWTGWALLVLAAVPVLVLTFFFFAVMLALFAVVAAIALVRIAWHRYRGRSAPSWRRARRHEDRNTFTVDVREITDESPGSAEEIRPGPPQPPPASSQQ
jgi:hypothetical protein